MERAAARETRVHQRQTREERSVHRLLKWAAAVCAAGLLLLWPEATFDGHRTFA